MPPSQSPLVRVATQFGYDLDETSLLTDPRVATTDTQAARLCAVLIEQVIRITDSNLRYAISRTPDYLHGVVADSVTAIERSYRAVARLLAMAVTNGAARQLAPGGTHTADPSLWRPGVVRIASADGGPYPCQIEPRDWNGWVRPRFTRDVAAQLIADLKQEWHRGGEHPGSLPGQLLEGGEVLLLHDEGVQEVISADDDDMFAVGAGTWMWEEWPY
ncbi:hypothetical protein [Micromonospora sonneratiae]|uniref:Uncharacterized protein n=1 Tax=Micromonospora sonneratiae TaxID=1184706 RepID=A0ABW3YIK3_9ACTN